MKGPVIQSQDYYLLDLLLMAFQERVLSIISINTAERSYGMSLILDGLTMAQGCICLRLEDWELWIPLVKSDVVEDDLVCCHICKNETAPS